MAWDHPPHVERRIGEAPHSTGDEEKGQPGVRRLLAVTRRLR